MPTQCSIRLYIALRLCIGAAGCPCAFPMRFPGCAPIDNQVQNADNLQGQAESTNRQRTRDSRESAAATVTPGHLTVLISMPRWARLGARAHLPPSNWRHANMVIGCGIRAFSGFEEYYTHAVKRKCDRKVILSYTMPLKSVLHKYHSLLNDYI